MSNLEHRDDWSLATEGGAPEASYAELFRRHKDYVHRVAAFLSGSAHAAADIVQEVFIRIYDSRARLRPRASFRSFLYAVARNAVREHRRKYNRAPPIAYRWEREAESVDVPGSNEPDARLEELNRLLRNLPPRQRETLMLRFFERKSVRETAAALGCGEGTVKSNLHWAMKSLRKQLAGRNHEQ